MKIYLKLLLLSLGIMLTSYDVSAHGNPTKTIRPVAKLPMAPLSHLTSLSEAGGLGVLPHRDNVLPSSGEPVLLNVPIVGGQFQFDVLDSSLEDYMATLHAKQSMMPPPGSPFIDVMQAVVDQQDKIQEAKNIIDQALVVGREIQSLILGELVSLPIYISETIGNK
ncbi:MAG: hypothetical protein ACI94Y_004554, partial [Maribacter sp.]